jgi:hypothetical protein
VKALIALAVAATAMMPGAARAEGASRFCLSPASVAFAKTAPMVWFGRFLAGGAHTWIFNNAEVVKAVTAFCGDRKLDEKLLSQIRFVLAPQRSVTATGGFSDQKQLGAALMMLLARRTPRIWNVLTAREKATADLTMEALAYASVFTTKDTVARQLGMDGDTNLSRDWNPNFPNGMVGMVIVTSLYFGPDRFAALLRTYDDMAFVARLREARMMNLLSTYANPDRPEGAMVQAGLRRIVDGEPYRAWGISYRDPVGLFMRLADRMFSRPVACGLDEGRGIATPGGARSGRAMRCEGLPDPGRLGMALEFDSTDAEGPRSSASYVFDAWYSLDYIRLALQSEGLLTRARVAADPKLREVLDRMRVGTRDIFFKIDPARGGGYRNYQHGADRGVTVLDGPWDRQYGASTQRNLFDVLQADLGLPGM